MREYQADPKGLDPNVAVEEYDSDEGNPTYQVNITQSRMAHASLDQLQELRESTLCNFSKNLSSQFKKVKATIRAVDEFKIGRSKL